MREAVFDMAPCGYFSFTDDGKVQDVNSTLCRLLGYTKEDLAGRPVESLFTLPTRIFYQTHFFPLVKMQGWAEELFLTLLTKDNEYLPVLLNAQRREEEGSVLTVCAFIVVPNRKKFEDELVAARHEAERALQENTALQKAKADLQHQAEKLDAQMQVVEKQNYELKQLNRVVSHDLREPLRKILVYADKLKTVLAGEEGISHVYKDIERLHKASMQMQATVAGLQQYVWLNDKAGQFVRVDLNSVLDKVQQQLEQEVGAGLLNLQADQLPLLEGDEGQLELLLYHLLSNAVKFRKGAVAQVRVWATLIQQNRFKAIEGKYKYEDYVRLEVRDEGIGFDPAFRNDAFDLFKRVSYKEGRGLGLALCKKIAENHFGSISADSREGVFTTITVLLPVVHGHGGQGPEHSLQGQPKD
jgi:phosphoserine phosphatase RsbU/P